MDLKEISTVLQHHAPVLANAEKPIVAEAGKDKVPFVLIPQNMRIESLKETFDEYLEKPERRRGTIKALNQKSFVNMTNRFKSKNSVLFCNGEIVGHSISASLKAVLNYHPEGGDNKAADWADHVVQYDFPVSKELKRWIEADCKKMEQADFAQFLEDNAADLVVPDEDRWGVKFGHNGTPPFAKPNDIFLLARGLEVRVKESVHNFVRLQNGTHNIQFTTEHESADGTPLVVPEWFALGVKVFEDGNFYQVAVRLRYKVVSGKINWSFEMYRLKEVFDMAFDNVCTEVETETAIPLFKGKPE